MAIFLAGNFDIDYIDIGQSKAVSSQEVTTTELVHILSGSAKDVPEDDEKVIDLHPPFSETDLPGVWTASTASALAALSQLGQIDAVHELNGENMHRLQNVLTLASDVYIFFERLSDAQVAVLWWALLGLPHGFRVLMTSGF